MISLISWYTICTSMQLNLEVLVQNRKSKGKHNSLKLQMSLTSEYSLCQIPSILTLQQPITWKNIINKAPIQHRALTTIKKP